MATHQKPNEAGQKGEKLNAKKQGSHGSFMKGLDDINS